MVQVKRATPQQLGEATLEAVALTMMADGDLATAEAALLARMGHTPIFQAIPDPRAVLKAALQRLMHTGLESALVPVTQKVQAPEDREIILATCLAMAAADGRIRDTETRVLRMLRSFLNVPEARARALAGPIAGIFS